MSEQATLDQDKLEFAGFDRAVDEFTGDAPPTSQLSASLPQVLRQLRATSALRRGWDSHGGSPPDARAIRGAETLIRSLARVADLPKPHVNPLPGGVQFEWEQAGRYFEIELTGATTAQCYFEDREARQAAECVVRVGESLDAVIGYIRRVASLGPSGAA
ncbi:MAG: hypothetical protein HYS13_05140 [Planctomycetia bacterium]|nr:hypothetical protein [Planctomycetia bacterium]